MLGQRNRYAGYRAFVLQGNDEETGAFYSKGNTGSIFGVKAFRQSISEDKENLQISTELPKALSVRPGLEAIVSSVAKVFKASEAEIVKKPAGRPRANMPRQIAMYCAQQLGVHSLKEIVEHFSLTNAASASRSISSMKTRLASGELQREYKQLEKLLGRIK